MKIYAPIVCFHAHLSITMHFCGFQLLSKEKVQTVITFQRVYIRIEFQRNSGRFYDAQCRDSSKLQHMLNKMKTVKICVQCY